MGRVVAISVAARHGDRPATVERARVKRDGGLEGDRHGRSGRQLLLIDTGTLRDLGLEPGDLREQIALDFPGLQSLSPGTVLQAGDVELRLGGPCEPCTHIGELLGKDDREAFRRELIGRRGVFAAAGPAGTVLRVGDPVEAVADPAEVS